MVALRNVPDCSSPESDISLRLGVGRLLYKLFSASDQWVSILECNIGKTLGTRRGESEKSHVGGE
jgi:hypothetical protein